MPNSLLEGLLFGWTRLTSGARAKTLGRDETTCHFPMFVLTYLHSFSFHNVARCGCFGHAFKL